MTGQRTLALALLFVALLFTSGCGSLVARSIARAPNRYPDWFDAEAPVTLAFNPKLLTNFPAHYAAVDSPAAKLWYRIVEPADYHFRLASTNWLENGERQYEFQFHAAVPGPTNQWTTAPRGTVVLLHGYGIAQFSMLPWALRLGQEGWRCVLVDLRGHGKSTGDRIYFGVQEAQDMREFLDLLERQGKVQGPVSVMGESLGAATALRWMTEDPRVHAVVAIAPFGSLSNAVMNIRRDYTPWLPKTMVRAGLRQLPGLLDIPPAELDTATVLRRAPVTALFIAGEADTIIPAPEVAALEKLASPDSRFLLVPEATHEGLTYYFTDLVPPVLAWLER